MLCRVSTLCHKASGLQLRTPLLIPSFSSKGFTALKKKDRANSEIRRILGVAKEFITQTYLISAYDVHHGFIQKPQNLPFTPKLIFLDSGGYEISKDRDLSAVVDPVLKPLPWSDRLLTKVLNSWPKKVPAVFISYDHPERRRPFLAQIKEAKALFREHGQQLHSFLLKPERRGQHFLDDVMKVAIAHADELKPFDIIGVTEKELGDSMLDRMVQIASLRKALNGAQIAAPIHVFGALDPVSVCLYFLSGAEIFDGLTWIRYGYDEGQCVYLHNLGPLRFGLHCSDDAVKSQTLSKNCYYLEVLQNRLREFAATGNYKKLKPHDSRIKEAWDSLKTRLGGES